MKRIGKHAHGLVTAILVLYLSVPVLSAWAVTAADALINLGVMPEVARYITNNLVTVNSSGDLVLPVASGKDAVVQRGDLSIAESGGTLLLQEATAGSKCMGTLTLTAATPVVTATTCAKTSSRIFLTRTSLDADTTGDMAVTAISDGVSFSVTSETSDTATVNWLIINEAP